MGKEGNKRRQAAKREIEQRLDEAHERSYPEAKPITIDDIMTAAEVEAAEEQLLGKKGVPKLNDPLPDFLQASVKAGPPRCPAPSNDYEFNRVTGKWVRKEGSAILMPPPKDDITVKRPMRTVTLIRDSDLEYPDLLMSVYVLGDPTVRDDESRFARLFARSGCHKADCIADADLVVFGGGADIDPEWYHESRHPMTYFDTDLDKRDMDAYLECVENGVPMFGVCRGAQWLHVCNGGKLYQDIDGHHTSHRMYCINDKTHIDNVSSVHHQSCRQNIAGGMEILAVASVSKSRWKNADDREEGSKPDIEAFFYRDTGCLGVQGHPEYQTFHRFSQWCLEQINHYFLCSPDYEWVPGKTVNAVYRMKKDLIGQRPKGLDQEQIELSYSPSMEA